MTMFLTAALDPCGCRSHTGRIIFDVLFAIGLVCVVVTTVVVGLRRGTMGSRIGTGRPITAGDTPDEPRYDDL